MLHKRPEYDMYVIGQNLKRLRVAKKLTVEDVRRYLCLGSVQAVYKYEEGRCFPQADTLLALMELYEATLADVVRDRAHGAGRQRPCRRRQGMASACKDRSYMLAQKARRLQQEQRLLLCRRLFCGMLAQKARRLEQEQRLLLYRRLCRSRVAA